MPVRRHLTGLGLSRVEDISTNTGYTYHQDEQGSTAYVTDITGETENLYSYDGFGTLLEKKEDITNRILYTGQQYDQETGQYYLRARYYTPVIGRFTQEDTYRGDGLNLYAYCGNNPVMYYDPSGHEKCNENKDSKKNKKTKTNAVGDGLSSNEKAKTGPKPKGTGPHNKKIEEIADQISDGEVIAGGRLPERKIETPDGYKSSRRPDILVERPDGSQYGINVGRTTANGAPVKREVLALYDLEDAGLPMYFVAYD